MTRHSPSPSLLSRFTAVLGAALVLVLTILAVSPSLHAWVHAEPADSALHTKCSHGHHHHDAPASADDEAGCIVNLFSQGGSELVALPALLPAPRFAPAGDTLPLSVFCAPSAPAYLLPPGCGPPAA